MCSRLCLATGLAEIKRHFAVTSGDPPLTAHWNITPGHVLPVIRRDYTATGRSLDLMRWGLIPAWAKTATVVQSSLVAGRSGALVGDLTKSTRRCLVPADNFYERCGDDNQPYAVALNGRPLMALAAVWDVWQSPSGERVLCFAILTTGPCKALLSFFERMPVVVFPRDWDLWLSREPAKPDQIAELLAPYPPADLTIWPVDRRIAKARNDDPDLLSSCTHS